MTSFLNLFHNSSGFFVTFISTWLIFNVQNSSNTSSRNRNNKSSQWLFRHTICRSGRCKELLTRRWVNPVVPIHQSINIKLEWYKMGDLLPAFKIKKKISWYKTSWCQSKRPQIRVCLLCRQMFGFTVLEWQWPKYTVTIRNYDKYWNSPPTQTAHCYTIVLLSPILSTSWNRRRRRRRIQS